MNSFKHAPVKSGTIIFAWGQIFCICKACEVSARKNMKRNSGENLTPRWKTQTNTSCSILFCSQRSAINKHLFCWNKISNSVGIASAEFDKTELKHYLQIVSSMWCKAPTQCALLLTSVCFALPIVYFQTNSVCYPNNYGVFPN